MNCADLIGTISCVAEESVINFGFACASRLSCFTNPVKLAAL